MKPYQVKYFPNASQQSTPSTAATIAFPFSAALSVRAIASSKAITSPFSTTGKCLNFPVNKIQFNTELITRFNRKEHQVLLNCYKPCTIFCRASTVRVSDRTQIEFFIIAFETGVFMKSISQAMNLVAISFNHQKSVISNYLLLKLYYNMMELNLSLCAE